jgi:hypothetical protein
LREFASAHRATDPSPDPDRCSQMHRCLAVPVPTFRLRDSLSECYITGRCLPAMTPRVLVMGDEVRTEENFFRGTITINSFTGRRPSSQARLLAPSPLRTVRNTFALHGSSTQQRPLNERGRSLIQVQVRPTRYWATADSHDDGKFTRRVGSRTNGLRRRHLLCFLHRFHKRSRVRAPAKSQLRFRRGDVVPNRRRNLYLRYYSAAFASFRAPIPTSPLSASRLPTPRLWGTIRVYSVPLE